MEFSDCDDIVQARHVNLRRYHYNRCIPSSRISLRKSLSCGIAFKLVVEGKRLLKMSRLPLNYRAPHNRCVSWGK